MILQRVNTGMAFLFLLAAGWMAGASTPLSGDDGTRDGVICGIPLEPGGLPDGVDPWPHDDALCLQAAVSPGPLRPETAGQAFWCQ